MSGSSQNLENLVARLHDEVAALRERILILERRMMDGPEILPQPQRIASDGDDAPTPAVSRTWSEGTVANLMSRGAAVSLILLLALVLVVRTLYDLQVLY